MPTGLVRPIPTAESQRIFNVVQGWQAPLGYGVRAIGFDDAGRNDHHAGDYPDEEGARRDMARNKIAKYKLFDQKGVEMYSSF